MGISESRMSSSRQSNQAKLGFFPTDLSVVELEMNLIDFSELQGSNIEVAITDLTGGIGEQLNHMHLYLNKLNIKNKGYYNELNNQRFNDCLSKYPHFVHVNANIKDLKIGSKLGKTIDKKVFGIIRDNPPYGLDTNSAGIKIRLEKEFYLINSEYDFPGAIHFLELPIGQADKELLSLISYRYNFKVFKFPLKEFNKFNQICIVMQKKNNSQKNTAMAEEEFNKILYDTLLPMDQVIGPAFKVSLSDFKKAKPIYYFRNKEITDDSLHLGAEQVWGEISKFVTKKQMENVVLNEKPVIELLQGHIATLLAAGRYNGVMGNFLIAGGSNKIINSTSEFDDDGNETITEIEMLQPYLEITNKNGDIMYKDF